MGPSSLGWVGAVTQGSWVATRVPMGWGLLESVSSSFLIAVLLPTCAGAPIERVP